MLHWPICNKLLVGISLLLVIVGTLSLSGFAGVYAFRRTVKSLSDRSTELPTAALLDQQVSELRVAVEIARHTLGGARAENGPTSTGALRGRFERDLEAVRQTVARYRVQLAGNDPSESPITDSRQELRTLRWIEATLDRLESIHRQPDWLSQPAELASATEQLEQLRRAAAELPSYLHNRLHGYAGQVRTEYRTLIGLTWLSTISAAVLLGLFIKLFHGWVFQPLATLVQGSRRVAAGDFDHRICMTTHDEMSELADALNEMTARFQSIRDDLDRQVRERTKQVVRSEQLASVGFLAAGVAHEINNPLASIAMCAESLESRLAEQIAPAAGRPEAADEAVARQYLRMIQEEAFRCKGITERLLDFSRLGDVQRQTVDLRELVQGVIEMVGHLGKYHGKRVLLAPGEAAWAAVNPQEMKQVVLNLLTNALDSLGASGTVNVELATRGAQVELRVADDGCGMTEDVLRHLFEPFFTRRRGGQGTGLGLSISYRIVADHDGQIDATSGGPGQGSLLRVTLPLAQPGQPAPPNTKEQNHRYQAA